MLYYHRLWKGVRESVGAALAGTVPLVLPCPRMDWPAHNVHLNFGRAVLQPAQVFGIRDPAIAPPFSTPFMAAAVQPLPPLPPLGTWTCSVPMPMGLK